VFTDRLDPAARVADMAAFAAGCQMLKLRETVSVALIMGALLVAVVGCEKPGPAEQAGKQVDKAVEKVGKQVDKAVEKLGQQVEKAGEAIQDAAKGDKK
jgi:hypothetical protein